MATERKGAIPTLFEDKLGFPPLSELGKTLQKLPSAEQLKLTKEILGTVERLMREMNALPSDKSERLERMITMVFQLYSMPIERMRETSKILKQIEKIIKGAPEQLLDFLGKLKEE